MCTTVDFFINDGFPPKQHFFVNFFRKKCCIIKKWLSLRCPRPIVVVDIRFGWFAQPLSNHHLGRSRANEELIDSSFPFLCNIKLWMICGVLWMRVVLSFIQKVCSIHCYYDIEKKISNAEYTWHTIDSCESNSGPKLSWTMAESILLCYEGYSTLE